MILVFFKLVKNFYSKLLEDILTVAARLQTSSVTQYAWIYLIPLIFVFTDEGDIASPGLFNANHFSPWWKNLSIRTHISQLQATKPSR